MRELDEVQAEQLVNKKLEEHAMSDTDRKTLLDALRFELRFGDNGGYDPSVREPHKDPTVFRDSPSCLNYASAVREHPCSECWLMDFVPPEKRAESTPCHHILLNERGDTVDSLARTDNNVKLQEILHGWLCKTIKEVEAKPSTTGAVIK